ncbi:hypothetical protein Pla175_08620 [Pirellulimonas nuda]|uniref:Uncharacterized protein n=1 Tax=Pirellulimonas nuda TaxID=2528009 RepID=A0A518D7P1_9BACT|nr:hypothetical protein [Pirellulimonas nuda]QDU87500.1 hypothetical protein Pla175_08620 [Pirellulimonas nuda]
MATRTPAKRTTPTRSAAAATKKPAAKSGAAKSSPKKTAARKSPAKPAKKVVGEEEVTVDRRRGEQAVEEAAPPKLERRKKVVRRRQIDPTTCERDYSDDEVQFMNALDEYKRASGRMFPTCSEVLEVVRGLGYVKLSPAELAAARATGEVEVEPLGGPQDDDREQDDSL